MKGQVAAALGAHEAGDRAGVFRPPSPQPASRATFGVRAVFDGGIDMIVDGDDYTYPQAAVAAGAAEIAELKRQLAQAQAALTKVTAERDAATRGAITLAIQAEQAEAALAAVAAAVPVGAFRGIDTMIRKNLDHTPWEWATIVKWLATLPQPEVPRDEDSANAPAQEWQKAALQKLLREVQP